ncbi:DUF6932 family protein [Spirosoma foliorum]|uniref:Polymerase nucleotidyl transferase domain-containing protein n=1 Tax=Spirosoma foliorum TaxID=2710596 RepID=A0A7G5GUY3_9BACT|nr:hypothetical protein [Spirosoma foliorum]QMW02675.1 hypothetical protein H3H32_33035 [Spirosoma foliorum]
MLSFDMTGHLIPYDGILSSLPEIETTFVDSIPESATRKDLFIQLVGYLTAFKNEISGTFTAIIDGSFATYQLNPNDVDVVIFLDYRLYEQSKERLDEFRRKARFSKIDSYIEQAYPINHPYYIRYQSDVAYWHSLFTRNRRKERKGYLQISYNYDA